MDDWNAYLLILALHRTQSLRGAATLLNTTHTTVARRLATLEKQHPTPVFERTANGYNASEYGKKLLQVALQMERLSLSSARQITSVSTQICGPITLSIGEPLLQYLFLKPLAAFQQQYPNLQLSIKCSTSFANLDEAEADVVVRSGNQQPPHLVGRRFPPFALAIYAQKHYFKSTKRTDLRWIAPSDSASFLEWTRQTPFPDAPIFLSIDDIVCRFIALEQGMGIGRAACFMADRSPHLVRVEKDIVYPMSDMWVLTHPDLRHTPKIKLFMQFLYEQMEKHEALLSGKTV